MSELYPPTRTELVTNAVLAGLADLVPGVGPFLEKLIVESARRQAAATGEVIRRVADELGEELFSRTVQESPRIRSLLNNTLDLCYRTSFEQKRWRLAEALKDCILDPSKINEAAAEQQALRDVEEPHILLLNELAQISDHLSREGPRGGGLELYNNTWNKVPAPIPAVLVNAGLAKELPNDYRDRGETLVTAYGVKVLDDFRRLGMQLDCAARPRSNYS